MSRRIRILHFAHIINRHDFADMVLSRIDRNRFEPAALAGLPPRKEGEYTESERYPVRILNLEFRRRNYLRMLRELRREVRAFRPDILHAHHFDENLVAAAAYRLGGIPRYVLGRHYSDQIYLWARGWKRRVFIAAENFSNRTACRIVVQNQGVASILAERQRIDRSKIRVLTHGMDFDRVRVSSPEAPARLRREHGLGERFVIVFCGRLIWIKAVETLLEAMSTLHARYPEMSLVLVGTGPQQSELETIVRDRGLDPVVKFLGWRSDAFDWMAAADVLVNPSLTESFPQVLIESLALGTPAVITPVGSAPEIVGDDERGLLIPPRDAGAIVKAIETLFGNPELRERIAGEGSRFVRERYRADRMVRAYEELYTEIAAEMGTLD